MSPLSKNIPGVSADHHLAEVLLQHSKPARLLRIDDQFESPGKPIYPLPVKLPRVMLRIQSWKCRVSLCKLRPAHYLDRVLKRASNHSRHFHNHLPVSNCNKHADDDNRADTQAPHPCCAIPPVPQAAIHSDEARREFLLLRCGPDPDSYLSAHHNRDSKLNAAFLLQSTARLR